MTTQQLSKLAQLLADTHDKLRRIYFLTRNRESQRAISHCMHLVWDEYQEERRKS